MIQIKNALIGTFIFALSSQAFSFVDAQLLIGQRFADFESDGKSESITAREATISAHISPLPIFGFGLYFTNLDYKTSRSDDVMGFDELKGSHLGAEVTADFPISLFDLGLYGKVGYAFYGSYTGKMPDVEYVNPVTGEEQSVNAEAEMKVSGYKLAAGLKWTPIAIVSALLEVNYGAEKWELEKFKVAGNSAIDGDGDSDQSYFSVLLGVEAAI